MVFERSAAEAEYARTLLPLARMWRRAADRALDGLGMSAAAGWTLVQVSRLGNDVRQSDLAAELDITGASLVRTLDHLVAADFVVRLRDAVDARISRVRLTVEGQVRAATIEQAFAALRSDMLVDIDDADLAAGLRVAHALADRFKKKRVR